MLKINNKYIYYNTLKKPELKEYIDEETYKIAYNLYNLKMNYGHLLDIDIIDNKVKLKVIKKRKSRIELKVGSLVKINRWDYNGTSEIVKIISIKSSISRAIIKTNKGYFIFSKYNSTNNDIHFNWTSSKMTWHKEYMNNINGNDYFLHIK